MFKTKKNDQVNVSSESHPPDFPGFHHTNSSYLRELTLRRFADSGLLSLL